MKKISLNFLTILCILSICVSCKKCITCKAYDRMDNSVKDEQKYCGPGITINDSEKNYIYINNNTLTFAKCK